jgi:hypothetical protein
MLDDEMITNGVEHIFVAPGRDGSGQPFVQFDVEHLVAQRLGGTHIRLITGEPGGVGSLRMNEEAGWFKQSSHDEGRWGAMRAGRSQRFDT